jgi:hypothetical protein
MRRRKGLRWSGGDKNLSRKKKQQQYRSERRQEILPGGRSSRCLGTARRGGRCGAPRPHDFGLENKRQEPPAVGKRMIATLPVIIDKKN